MKTLVLIGTLTAILAACSGSSSSPTQTQIGASPTTADLIHFLPKEGVTAVDETEGQVRADLRAGLANPIAAKTLCGVNGLSNADAARYLQNLSNGTPTGYAVMDAQSLVRFVTILQEECARIK